MADILDLPMLNGIDVRYPLQCVKLARALRDRMQSGECWQGDTLSTADFAHDYKVSIRVIHRDVTMLVANRYVGSTGAFTSYGVIWQAGT